MAINPPSIKARRKRPISVEMYHKIIAAGILTENDKVELINGEIIDMSPVGSEHISAVNKLTRNLIILYGEAAIVSVQNPISIGGESEPEPDIAIIQGDINDFDEEKASARDVVILFEVSNETYKYDKSVKLALYAESGIPIYVIVNLQEECVEVHSFPKNDTYTRQEILFKEEELSLPLISEKLALSSIFRKS